MIILNIYPHLSGPVEGAVMRRRESGIGCGARGRRQTQPLRSGGPGQPSAPTMRGCLQWLDARDTKGGGSRPDGKARKAFPVHPRGSTAYGDRKAAGGAPRGAARSPMSARTKKDGRATCGATPSIVRGNGNEKGIGAYPAPSQRIRAMNRVCAFFSFPAHVALPHPLRRLVSRACCRTPKISMR